MKIGDSIRQRRIEMNGTQAELADMVGISRESMMCIENNSKRPSDRTLKKISEVLNVPEYYFYFMSLKRDDIPEGKRDLYDVVYPTLKELIFKII